MNSPLIIGPLAVVETETVAIVAGIGTGIGTEITAGIETEAGEGIGAGAGAGAGAGTEMTVETGGRAGTTAGEGMRVGEGTAATVDHLHLLRRQERIGKTRTRERRKIAANRRTGEFMGGGRWASVSCGNDYEPAPENLRSRGYSQ
jgi:hypothetical protein